MMKETCEDSLEVWLATGRDQTQVKRNLINTYFTKNTGIAVDLKLVAAGTLLPSILAQKGPDVYHGLDQGSVINYAIRNAILPVDGFEDFEEVAGLLKDENGNTVNRKGEIIEAQFNEASMIVLKMEDANGIDHYYGLPEAQGFAMMFVRVDILADLGIDVPRTWDDIMAAIPKLQAKNMQMGLTTDSTIHLYQMGGELFADE
jgi:ABC-type glycerol-3-phosphate transport system substrate-binding protein